MKGTKSSWKWNFSHQAANVLRNDDGIWGSLAPSVLSHSSSGCLVISRSLILFRWLANIGFPLNSRNFECYFLSFAVKSCLRLSLCRWITKQLLRERDRERKRKKERERAAKKKCPLSARISWNMSTFSQNEHFASRFWKESAQDLKSNVIFGEDRLFPCMKVKNK